MYISTSLRHILTTCSRRVVSFVCSLSGPQESVRSRSGARHNQYLQTKVKRPDHLFDLRLRNDLQVGPDQSLRDLLDLRQPRFRHRGPHHGRFYETSEPDCRLIPDMKTTNILEDAAS